MLATILDFPYPTIALLTGHSLGGACLFALAHDYRIMNSSRGFFHLPAIDLGLSFPGVGILPRLKLGPKVARKLLLEAHRWTSKEAFEDGVVDAVFEPEEMMGKAVVFGERWGDKAKGGVYGVLRDELWGESGRALRSVSWVHRQPTALGKAKL
jgi:enoyl-CoA hydratase/carnithine racemase